MRRIAYCVAAGIGILSSFACSKNEMDQVNNTHQELEFLVLTDENKEDLAVFPRIAFSDGEWTGREIVDNTSVGKSLVLQFINRKEKTNMLVVCADNSVCFIANEPQQATISNNAVICEMAEGSLCVINADYDWDTETYTVLCSNSYDVPAESEHTIKKRVSLPDDERRFFYNMLDKLGTTISAGEYIPASVQKICTFWTSVVIPIAKYQLYSFDPDIQDSIRDEIALDAATNQSVIIKSVKNAIALFNMAKDLFNYGSPMRAYERFIDSFSQEGYDDASRTLSSYPSWTRNMNRMIELEEKRPGKLYFSINHSYYE